VASSYVNSPCGPSSNNAGNSGAGSGPNPGNNTDFDDGFSGAGVVLGGKRASFRIPGGLVLFTLGLFGLALLTRRRKSKPDLSSS